LQTDLGYSGDCDGGVIGMDSYRVTVGVEPTNDYDKAKQEVIQAMTSVHKLPVHQQQKLAEELVGSANVAVLLNIFNQAFGR